MKINLLLLCVGLASCFSVSTDKNMTDSNSRPDFALAIHGGAGVITRSNLTEVEEKNYRETLDQAISIGEQILSEGGNAIDAVTAICVFMEDSPLFNAGKGSVFTHEGDNEMDASIMDGSDLNAGAVGGIHLIKNPILAARAVLDKSEHVMLTGKGAEDFCAEHQIETADKDYFYTERRWQALQRLKSDGTQKMQLDHDDRKHGTVGAVALDRAGNLAAATSTGGMTNKRYNRIGDSPIIGAGTYANNNTCAVSSTGHGEYFIRLAVAHDISTQMEYGGKSLQEAGDHTIHEKLQKLGGTGGIISVDRYGNIHMPFNTEGMYRGFALPGIRKIMIYQDE